MNINTTTNYNNSPIEIPKDRVDYKETGDVLTFEEHLNQPFKCTKSLDTMDISTLSEPPKTVSTPDLQLLGKIMSSSIVQTGEITDEIKEMLSDKYNVNELEEGSPEFEAFMNELCDLGIISGTMPANNLNIINASVQSNGYVSILSKVDEDVNNNATNAQNWYQLSLMNYRNRYDEVVEKEENLADGEVLSMTDTIFKNYYESYQTVNDVLKEFKS